MKSFWWCGVDKLGHDKKGLSLANSEKHLQDLLLAQGIALLEYRQKREKFSFATFVFQKKVNLEQKAFFFEQLSALLGSSVDLLAALTLVGAQTKSKKLKNSVFNIITQIRSGSSFSDALGKEDFIFDSFLVQMVWAGENSGKLGFVLEKISNYLNARLKLVKHLKHAAFIPFATLFFAIVIFLGIFVFVIPQFEFFFNMMGGHIPQVTQFVIKVSCLFRSFGLLPGVILFLFFLLLLKSALVFSSIKKMKDKIALKIYFFGKIFLLYDLISFLQVLSMVLRSGIDLKEALRFSSKVIKNSIFVEKIRFLEESITKGQSFADSLKLIGNEFFPDTLVTISHVGEQTGKLDLMLQKAASFFQDELDKKLKLAINAFQPAMMILVGLLIFFLIVSVYVPIFNMASLL